MLQRRLTDWKDIEPQLEKSLVVKMVAPVKQKGRTLHALKDARELKVAVLQSLRDKRDGMCPISGLISIIAEGDVSV